METPRKLSVRLGCPLALALTAAFVLFAEAGRAWVMGRAMSLEWWPLPQLGALAAPFLVLAAARTRDWMAWSVAIALTAALFCWLFYSLSLREGVNFTFILVQLFVAPLAISGLAVATAGARGRIPDWGQEEKP
jgi:hypothetical protein